MSAEANDVYLLLKSIFGEILSMKIMSTSKGTMTCHLIANTEKLELIEDIIKGGGEMIEYNFDKNKYMFGCLQTLSPTPDA